MTELMNIITYVRLKHIAVLVQCKGMQTGPLCTSYKLDYETCEFNQARVSPLFVLTDSQLGLA